MKKIILLIFLFIPLVVLGYNETINPLCTIKEKDILRKSVLNFSYALEKYKEDNQIYYQVTIYNLNKDVVVDYDKNVYTVDNNVINHIVPGTKVSLKIYANPSGICEGYIITTKVITIPYYNKYKDNSLCVGNEEYFLCKENTNTSISEKEFEKQINQYVKEKKEIEKEEDDEITVIHEETDIERILYFLKDYYLYIFLPIILVGTVSIIFIVAKKKRELF
jgi:hypothetical protein